MSARLSILSDSNLQAKKKKRISFSQNMVFQEVYEDGTTRTYQEKLTESPSLSESIIYPNDSSMSVTLEEDTLFNTTIFDAGMDISVDTQIFSPGLPSSQANSSKIVTTLDSQSRAATPVASPMVNPGSPVDLHEVTLTANSNFPEPNPANSSVVTSSKSIDLHEISKLVDTPVATPDTSPVVSPGAPVSSHEITTAVENTTPVTTPVRSPELSPSGQPLDLFKMNTTSDSDFLVATPASSRAVTPGLPVDLHELTTAIETEAPVSCPVTSPAFISKSYLDLPEMTTIPDLNLPEATPVGSPVVPPFESPVESLKLTPSVPTAATSASPPVITPSSPVASLEMTDAVDIRSPVASLARSPAVTPAPVDSHEMTTAVDNESPLAISARSSAVTPGLTLDLHDGTTAADSYFPMVTPGCSPMASPVGSPTEPHETTTRTGFDCSFVSNGPINDSIMFYVEKNESILNLSSEEEFSIIKSKNLANSTIFGTSLLENSVDESEAEENNDDVFDFIDNSIFQKIPQTLIDITAIDAKLHKFIAYLNDDEALLQFMSGNIYVSLKYTITNPENCEVTLNEMSIDCLIERKIADQGAALLSSYSVHLLKEPRDEKMIQMMKKTISSVFNQFKKENATTTDSLNSFINKLRKPFHRIEALFVDLFNVLRFHEWKIINANIRNFEIAFEIYGLRYSLWLILNLDLTGYPNDNIQVKFGVHKADLKLYPYHLFHRVMKSVPSGSNDYIHQIVKTGKKFILDWRHNHEKKAPKIRLSLHPGRKTMGNQTKRALQSMDQD